MGMTITEKIFAAHSNNSSVKPGQLINAKVDLALGNDITAPIAIKEVRKMGIKKVFDKERVVLVPDHFTPNKDIKSAEQVKMLRDFAADYNLTNYFEVGCMGVEHALLPEQGLSLPGDLIIGADSHTCTYGALGAFSTGVGSTDLAAAMITGEIWLKTPASLKFIFNGKLNKWVSGKDLILYVIGKIGVDGALYKSMEFCGPVIKNLDMSNRMTMCNMAIEAGGKNGIIEPDEITENYVKTRAKRKYTFYKSDDDAVYEKIFDINVNDIEPLVALPHLPENVKPVKDVKNIKIDQVVIGSCTNGRFEDLEIAAKILKGKKVAKNVRCIIIPATQKIWQQAMNAGFFDIFVEANAVVSTPTCGPCLGGHMGILAKGERAVATTNRNFVGRMGDVESEVYLTNPAVAAASAITGKISHPDEV
ncbi:3-isopropylmalate dehydratase large subunit [Candidatus Dependentiae bacterium]|nr:3-isopropylmalate dehydratase large subunit [Candidatus Dependentiae bacterium]